MTFYPSAPCFSCGTSHRCPRCFVQPTGPRVARQRPNPLSMVHVVPNHVYLVGLSLAYPLTLAPVDSIAAAVGPELVKQGFRDVGVWSAAGAPPQWRRPGKGGSHVLLARYIGTEQDIDVSGVPGGSLEWVEDVTAAADAEPPPPGPGLPGAPGRPPPSGEPSSDADLYIGAAVLLVGAYLLLRKS